MGGDGFEIPKGKFRVRAGRSDNGFHSPQCGVGGGDWGDKKGYLVKEGTVQSKKIHERS